MSEGGLERKLKVRFETDLEREVAIAKIEAAGFRIIPMRHNDGLFGEYRGRAEEYSATEKELASNGIRVVYRESEANCSC